MHAPVRRLASFATPLMRELAQRSKQANQLAVFDRGSAVVIAQQEAPDYWGISIRVGSHISLFDTGSGHVLLAFRSPEEREMMISEHVRSRDEINLTPEFYARLDQIRERGYEMMARPRPPVSTTSRPRSWGPTGAASGAHLPLYLPGQQSFGP